MRQSTLIYISLGGNIQPEYNLRRAINRFNRELVNCRVSSVFRSPAVGMEGADFLNAVVGGSTVKTRAEVTHWLRDIEAEHGRVRTADKFTDRPLDLDLLLFGNLVDQEVPHHEILEQAYVLEPLSELAPELVHPRVGLSIIELNRRLQRESPEQYSAMSKVHL